MESQIAAERINESLSKNAVVVQQMITNKQFINYIKQFQSREEVLTNPLYPDVLSTLINNSCKIEYIYYNKYQNV